MSSFACDACGKRFAWKPQLAGRNAKCKCGQVLRVPATDPATEGDEGLYDLADDTPTAGAASVKPRPVVVEQEAPPEPEPSLKVSTGPEVGLDESVSRKLLERGVLPGTKKKDLLDENPLAKEEPRWRSYHLPILLIGVGVLLTIFAVRMTTEGPPKPMAQALTDAGIQMAISLGLVFGGVFLAAILMGIELPDSKGITMLKLAAVSLAPSAVAVMLLTSLGEINGAIVGQLTSVALYAALFFALFRLQATDIAMCVVVIVILNGLGQYLSFQIEGLLSGSWI
jgi:hypothetical protein